MMLRVSFAVFAVGLAAKPPTQPQRALRATKVNSAAAVAPAAPVIEVEEVDVPVVVVLEGGDDDAAPAAMGLSLKCRKEMIGKMQGVSLQEHLKCEQQQNSTTRVMNALRHANNTEALALTARTFTECMKLSQVCANEIAPDVVLKARFSGMAVSTECKQKAEFAMVHKGDGSCERNTTKAMVAQLKKRNMAGAIHEAQDGLVKCNSLSPPCNFQFAPMLVMQLIQMAQQQQMQMAIMSGLRQMNQIQAAMMSEMMKAKEKAALAKKPLVTHPNATVASKRSENPTAKKALSLLDVASRIQIVPKSHTVSL